MKSNDVKIPSLLWMRLLRQLRKRGDGFRESGSFLLGKTESRRVCKFLCYDDLDEAALDSGIVTVHAIGFVRLWDICQKQHLRVLADVHTHPTSWIEQSESDRTHPMVAQPGHFALILPNFAKPNRKPLGGAAVYEYLGDHNWKSWPVKSAPVKTTIL
jgi:proteasome lid subunit RPN8/RPN11